VLQNLWQKFRVPIQQLKEIEYSRYRLCMTFFVSTEAIGPAAGE